jgi:hypothetical protein
MKVTRKWLVVFVLMLFTLGVGVFQRPSLFEQYATDGVSTVEDAELKRNLCVNTVCGSRSFDTTCVYACQDAIANAPKCTSNYPVFTDSTNISWGEDVQDGVSVKCVHLR